MTPVQNREARVIGVVCGHTPNREDRTVASCHGTSIEPEVTAGLDALYPEGRARGFDVGDLRGAFSIAQPVP